MTMTTVKTYRNMRGFQRDAPRMARQGYQVVATFQEPSKNKPLRNLLKVPVGGARVWGSSIKGGKIVVTYQAYGATVVAPQPQVQVEAPALRPAGRRRVRARTLMPAASRPAPSMPPAVMPPTGREPLQWGSIMGGLVIMALVCAVALVLVHAL